MERSSSTGPEHESLEDEGIPDIGRPHPAKKATGDPQEGLVAPRDRARGAADTGVTADEQREGASLGERLTEEEPDRDPGGRHDAGRLFEDGSGLVDEEKDLVADAAEEELEGRSAEESAVRIEEAAPEGTTDGPDSYLEDETER